MRLVVLCMGVCFGLGTASAAFAQAPAPLVRVETPAKQASAPSPQRRRAMTDAEQQIYDRAVVRARERELRLESKKWAGYVPSRPAVRVGNYNLGNEWYGYYQNPFVSHQPFSFYRGF